MGNLKRHQFSSTALTAAVAILATAVLVASAAAANRNAFLVTNLVSDQPGVAASVDPDLVNAWGLAALPTSPWWVADNGQSVSTLYRADGSKVGLTVAVPDDPTGIVANAGSSFVVKNGAKSAAALFIFATEDGQILGWNPNVAATTAGSRFRIRTTPSTRASRSLRPPVAIVSTRPTSTTAVSTSSTGASRM